MRAELSAEKCLNAGNVDSGTGLENSLKRFGDWEEAALLRASYVNSINP